MRNRRLARALPALVLAVVLFTPPVFAAPSPDTGVAVRLVQVFADWWGKFTRPLVSVFAAYEETAPDTAPNSNEDPTAQPAHGKTVDPNG